MRVKVSKNHIFPNKRCFLNLGLLASILDIENVKSGFKTILKKRPNNYRSFILVVGKMKHLLSCNLY